MSRRLVTYLPPLVILAGVGVIGFYFFEQRSIEKDRVAHENSNVAEKVDVLPGSSDPGDADRQIAEAAFSSPEQVDSSPPVSYGKPHKMNNLFGDPGANTTNPVESIEYKPRPFEPPVDGLVAATPSTADLPEKDDSERVDPESKEYQERVNSLMEMRQRRLREKVGSNEK